MHDKDVLTALRGLVPEGAGIGWADPAEDYPLMPGEVLPGAVSGRLREFAAGRAAARLAMEAIGITAQAIPQGTDRAPVWPAGVTGSITHTRSECLAVAMHVGICRGIGIDLEEDSPLGPELWDTILRPEERAGMTGARAMAVFSAKEAAFKAQYPQSQRLFGFHAMRIEQSESGFTAIFTHPVPPFAVGDRIEGRMIRAGRHVLTLASL